MAINKKIIPSTGFTADVWGFITDMIPVMDKPKNSTMSPIIYGRSNFVLNYLNNIDPTAMNRICPFLIISNTEAAHWKSAIT